MIKKSNPILAAGVHGLVNAARALRSNIKWGMRVEGGPGAAGYKGIEKLLNRINGQDAVLKWRQLKSIPNSTALTAHHLALNEARNLGAAVKLPQRLMSLSNPVSTVSPALGRSMRRGAVRLRASGQHALANSDNVGSPVSLGVSLLDDALAQTGIAATGNVGTIASALSTGTLRNLRNGFLTRATSMVTGVPIDLMRRAVRTYGPVIGGGGFMPRASQMPGYSLLKNVNRW